MTPAELLTMIDKRLYPAQVLDDLEAEPREVILAALRVAELAGAMFTTERGEAIVTVNILRHWDRERIERFARHLLGDEKTGGTMDRFSELRERQCERWQKDEMEMVMLGATDKQTILDALKLASEYHRVSESLGLDADGDNGLLAVGKKLGSLESALAAAREEIARLRLQIVGLEANLDLMARAARENREASEHRYKWATAQQSRADTAESQLAESRSRVSELENRTIYVGDSERAEARRYIDELKRDLAESRSEVERLKAEIRLADEEIEQFKLAANAAREETRRALEKYCSLQSAVIADCGEDTVGDATLKRLVELEKEVDRLKGER